MYHLNILENEPIVQITLLSWTAQLRFFLNYCPKNVWCIFLIGCFFQLKISLNKISAPTMLKVVIRMFVHVHLTIKLYFKYHVSLIIALTNSTHSHLHIYSQWNTVATDFLMIAMSQPPKELKSTRLDVYKKVHRAAHHHTHFNQLWDR